LWENSLEIELARNGYLILQIHGSVTLKPNQNRAAEAVGAMSSGARMDLVVMIGSFD